jgi:hypothetical protein
MGVAGRGKIQLCQTEITTGSADPLERQGEGRGTGLLNKGLHRFLLHQPKILHWCEMPAPGWAHKLADEAIRERDCVPCTLFSPTPREEDGSRDDLLYWLRAAERFVEAVKVGWVHKSDWLYWRHVFESIPVVNAHFLALLPGALRARRLRREYARVEKARSQAVEVQAASRAVHAFAMQHHNARAQWGRKNQHNR